MATILSLEKKLFEKKLKEDPPVQGNPTHLNSRGNLTDDYGREIYTTSMQKIDLKALDSLRSLLREVRHLTEDFVGWDDEIWAAKGSRLTVVFSQKLFNEGYDIAGAEQLLRRITKPAHNTVCINKGE